MDRTKKGAYARAGVDVRKVGDIHGLVAGALSATFSTRRGRFGEPLIGIGHYAGLIDIGGGRALAMHTDGVGTKVQVAIQMRKYDTIGIDCVAMTVNDLVCLGCEPVALLDYLALEREDSDLVAQIMKGLVEGAKEASAAIVGGETAIMGKMVEGFDLVSMGVGVVDKEKIVDGSSIRAGDRVIGLASSGLHSNGYTLARHVLLRRYSVDDYVPALEETVGEALLVPTCIYVGPVLEALKRHDIHGIGHITGGSFSKLSRLAGKRRLQFELRLPEPPAIFKLIQREGGLSHADMLETFNMGVGLCVVVPPEEVEPTLKLFGRRGLPASEVGVVKEGKGVRVDSVVLSR